MIQSDKANSKMLMRKYLTQELFDALKDKKTSRGVTVWDCINSGVVNLDSGTPVCYTVISIKLSLQKHKRNKGGTEEYCGYIVLNTENALFYW